MSDLLQGRYSVGGGILVAITATREPTSRQIRHLQRCLALWEEGVKEDEAEAWGRIFPGPAAALSPQDGGER